MTLAVKYSKARVINNKNMIVKIKRAHAKQP